jgi:hypothetical protein
MVMDGFEGSSSFILDPITPRAQKSVSRLWTNLNICEEKCRKYMKKLNADIQDDM